jgi:hypothetical protein
MKKAPALLPGPFGALCQGQQTLEGLLVAILDCQSMLRQLQPLLASQRQRPDQGRHQQSGKKVTASVLHIESDRTSVERRRGRTLEGGVRISEADKLGNRSFHSGQ